MSGKKISGGTVLALLVFVAGAWAADLEPIPAEEAAGLDATHQTVAELPQCPSSEVPECSPCPDTYGYVEGLALNRDNRAAAQPLLVLFAGPDVVGTALSTSELDFDFDPAMRVVAGRRWHDGWAVEGAYLGLFESGASAFVEAPPPNSGLVLGFPPGGLGASSNVFRDITRSWIDYSSELHSIELNLVSCCGHYDPCESFSEKRDPTYPRAGRQARSSTIEYLVGFRYLRLSEHFRLYAEADEPSTPGGAILTTSGFYDVRTGNNLYGAQSGVRMRRWGERLGWEASGKAGIYGIDMSQNQSVVDYPGFPLRPASRGTGGDVAFVGDVNLSGVYRLTDVWNVRAGYNLIWVAGVALAPDQLDWSAGVASGRHLDRGGSVLVHGISCGAEARW